ncbi:MAG: hypothetical protein KKD48_00925 [Nanoarchaeota archaeon]|nr:hypothetical protein [Nanoarchaeota archaeon]
MARVVFKIPTNEDIVKHIFAFVKELKENYKQVILIDIPPSLIYDIIHKNFSRYKKVYGIISNILIKFLIKKNILKY